MERRPSCPGREYDQLKKQNREGENRREDNEKKSERE